MLSVVGYSTLAAEPYIDPPSSGRGGFLLRRWPSRLTHSRPGFSLAIGSLFSSSPVYLLSVSKGRNPFDVRYAFNTSYTYILLINVLNTLSKEEFFCFYTSIYSSNYRLYKHVIIKSSYFYMFIYDFLHV